MRLAWRSIPPWIKVSEYLCDFTAHLIRDEESSANELLDILPTFISEARFHGKRDRTGRFADVVKICLNQIGKRPDLGWELNSDQILDSTLELFQHKGIEAMDPEMLDSWLKFV